MCHRFLDGRGIIRDGTLQPSELTIAIGINRRINRNIMSSSALLFLSLVLFAKFLTMSKYFYNQAENQHVLL